MPALPPRTELEFKMNLDALYSELTLKLKTKVVLVVLDGLGDIATREQKFLTPLEAATTPHLDALAKESAQGRMIPVAPGITPGSGPGHLGLFGYDPLEFQVGRGVIEALGLGVELKPGDVCARAPDVLCSGVGCVDQGAEPQHVIENPIDAAMVGDPDFDSGANEIARNIGLNIGKTDDKIRLQCEDRLDFCTGERRDFRLFLARTWRPDRETGNSDDAPFLAKRVKHFGRLFGEADDALRAGHEAERIPEFIGAIFCATFCVYRIAALRATSGS